MKEKSLAQHWRNVPREHAVLQAKLVPPQYCHVAAFLDLRLPASHCIRVRKELGLLWSGADAAAEPSGQALQPGLYAKL